MSKPTLFKWGRVYHKEIANRLFFDFETILTDLVFVIDWKTSKRSFYAYPNDENPEISNTFDMLCNGTEIT
ncbi:MAG: hypothetical protein J0H93_03765 [Chlamydiales bacterium]|nr:hypothetical protein [Chlamydiales bacterium]